MSRIRIGVGIMKKIPHCLCPQFAIPVSVNSWNINTWLKRSINNAAHFKWNCYRVLIQSTLCYSLTRGAAELNTDCSRCTLHIKVELQVQAYREQSRGEREIHLPLNFYVTLHWSKHIILRTWPLFPTLYNIKAGTVSHSFLHSKRRIALTALFTQRGNKLKAGEQYLQIKGQFPLRLNLCMAHNIGHGYVK